MKPLAVRSLGLLLVLLLLSPEVLAQDAQGCSAIVEKALAAVAELCDETGSDELCYGNTTVSVITVAESNISFSTPGDIIPITQIQSVQTTALEAPDEWGVSLMRIRANVPDTMPGQNVTFLLFGDIDLTNATPQPVSIAATTTGNINVRSGPSTGHAVAGSLPGSTALELIGRNSAGDWVFFAAEDATGWLFASLLEIDGDVITLDEVPDDYAGGSKFGPMQVIYFTTGIGMVSCSEAPQDGILIQTPGIDEPIELLVNDVQLRLGSTAYLQAQAGSDMIIYLVEGAGRVRSNDVTRVVPAGAFTMVPLGADGRADGPPSEPEPYETEALIALPLAVMDRQIALADPATPESIVEANTPTGPAGQWQGTASNAGAIIVTITDLGGDQYALLWTEPCDPTRADPGVLTMEGEGLLVDNILTFAGTWACSWDPAGMSGNTSRIFMFDPDVDTLTILERPQDNPVFTRVE